jgi:hypothetical protein
MNVKLRYAAGQQQRTSSNEGKFDLMAHYVLRVLHRVVARERVFQFLFP